MHKSIIATFLVATSLATVGCRQSGTAKEGADNSADTAAARAPYASLVASSGNCDTPTTPFCDAVVPLPADWGRPAFKLAQDYPAAAPAERGPWLAFDPKTQPDQYIRSVLSYFYEGNIRASVEDSFDPALNKKRQWYNAPWQDVGFNGREPAHGLTRERVNLPGELDPAQKSSWNNYAVGFYNAAGASTIGKVWANHGAPDASKGIMPEGTVGAKLLFTTATVAEVPYLAGSPEWNAYIYTQVNAPNPDPKQRSKIAVRLLQIDVAVKDKRSPTGWVFGTFVYGGGPAPGTTRGSGWTNVSPVGLMWGNDPAALTGGPIKESWINPKVRMPHIGFAGRLNGPVDNKVSSCLSCHSTAQDPSNTAPMIPPDSKPATLARWFRNIPSGQAFTPPAQPLDYSLQVSLGIKNFRAQQTMRSAPAGSTARNKVQATLADSLSPRDGAQTH